MSESIESTLKAAGLNEAQTIASMGASLAEMNRVPEVRGCRIGPDFLAIPGVHGDWKIRGLEQYEDTPRGLRGSVRLDNAASFLDFVRRYTGERSVAVYADRGNLRWVAVFDHLTEDAAGWCAFRATLPFLLDSRFTPWQGNAGKWISQAEFADFLEDNARCIVHPTAAELIDIVSDLKAVKTVDFQSTRTLRNDSMVMAWGEQLKESREVPLSFMLQLPVFDSSDKAYEVKCRLRYRITDQKQLQWSFRIDQMDEMMRTAWKAECEELASLPEGVPFFMGAAPAEVVPLPMG